MRIFSFVFASLIGFCGTVQAAEVSSELLKAKVESLSECGQFIRFDQKNVYSGLGNGYDGHVLASPLASSLTSSQEIMMKTLGSPLDLISTDESILVLTNAGLEEWNPANLSRQSAHSTYSNPQAFAKYKNTLIIVHGHLGVSFFDLQTKKTISHYQLISRQEPLVSAAKGVVVVGNLAYVVLDSYSLVEPHEKPAFRGLVIINMDSKKVVKELDGLDPGAESLVSDGKNLIVSFYGIPLWKYSLSSLNGNKLPEPVRRMWKFPYEGHPIGLAALDQKYYYTCFSKLPAVGEGGSMLRVPVALDRQTLEK